MHDSRRLAVARYRGPISSARLSEAQRSLRRPASRLHHSASLPAAPRHLLRPHGASTKRGWWNAPIFLALGLSMLSFLPTRCPPDQRVAAAPQRCQRRIGRRNAAMSPTTPPPTATMSESRSTCASSAASQSLDAADVLCSSPGVRPPGPPESRLPSSPQDLAAPFPHVRVGDDQACCP